MIGEEAHFIRQNFAEDLHRPLFHFLPPNHWMNDPNGLIHWNGKFHLFYQHNPYSAAWGKIHWGHAISSDLIHWTDCPIALSPSEGGWDEDGCWSGCAINFHQIPTLLYTGRQGDHEWVCIATSQDDDLLSWQKHPRNPVLVHPPKEKILTGFRDPYVWKNGLDWRMIIGSGFPGKGGVIFIYKSTDLMRWELIGPFFQVESLEYGDMWECPNLMHLGKKYVLFFSLMGFDRVFYLIGDIVDDQFIPERQGDLDGANVYYAPLGFFDNTGRAIVFGWVKEDRSKEAQLQAGWSGIQALPRQLSLSENNTLIIEPVDEVKKLRRDCVDLGQVFVNSDNELFLPISGNCLEIVLTITVQKGISGVDVLCSPDFTEFTRIGFDGFNNYLFIDRSRSSISISVPNDTQRIKIEMREGETLELHIFIDRSIVEVFANRHYCLTSRVYPERKDSIGLCLFSRHSDTIFNLRGWKMEHIWPG